MRGARWRAVAGRRRRFIGISLLLSIGIASAIVVVRDCGDLVPGAFVYIFPDNPEADDLLVVWTKDVDAAQLFTLPYRQERVVDATGSLDATGLRGDGRLRAFSGNDAHWPRMPASHRTTVFDSTRPVHEPVADQMSASHLSTVNDRP